MKKSIYKIDFPTFVKDNKYVNTYKNKKVIMRHRNGNNEEEKIEVSFEK